MNNCINKRKNFVLLVCVFFIIVNLSNCVKPTKIDYSEKSFDTPIECIEYRMEFYRDDKFIDKDCSYYKSIYVYEDDKQYIEFFNSSDLNIWVYILDIDIIEGKKAYKYNHSETTILPDYWRNINNISFKTVKNLNDIEDDIKQDEIHSVNYYYLDSKNSINAYLILEVDDNEPEYS